MRSAAAQDRRKKNRGPQPPSAANKISFAAKVTTKNWLFESAPKRLQLFGDKARKLESSTHIIEFPGGAIELSRTSQGDYWAHLITNHDWAHPDIQGREHAYGDVIGARIDDDQRGVRSIPRMEHIHQVALLIRPRIPGARK